MNEMILAVLAVLFVAESNLATKYVPLERMPKECASVYRDYAHEVFGVTPAQGTEMAEVDFDCDGRNELPLPPWLDCFLLKDRCKDL